MAAGDVFANMYVFSTSSGYDIRPAVGVSAMITFMGTSDSNVGFKTINSTGSVQMSTSSGSGTTQSLQSMDMIGNMKLFITNAEYIKVIPFTGSASFDSAYTGVEM